MDRKFDASGASGCTVGGQGTKTSDTCCATGSTGGSKGQN